MDATVVLGQQGRLVIPAGVREALGLAAGDELHLHLPGRRRVLERPRDAARVLTVAGVRIEPVTGADAELAGALRGLPGGRAPSPGDRCCLTRTTRVDSSSVLAADRARADLDLPVHVLLIR